MPGPANELPSALPQSNEPVARPRHRRAQRRIDDGGMRAKAKALVRMKYLELSVDERRNIARDWDEDDPNDFMENIRDDIISILRDEFSEVPEFETHLMTISFNFELMTPIEEFRLFLYGEDPVALPLVFSRGPAADPQLNVINEVPIKNDRIRRLGG